MPRIFTEKQKEEARLRSNLWYKNNKEKALASSKIYRASKKDYFIQYRKKYYIKNKEKVIMDTLGYRRNNFHRVKEQQKNWYENNKEHVVDRISKYNKKRPLQMKARRDVNNAIRDGRLIRLPCEKCGSEKNINGHHEDYNKPLEVRWLCRKHHYELHRKYE